MCWLETLVRHRLDVILLEASLWLDRILLIRRAR